MDDGSGDVSWEEFVAMCQMLGVPCSVAEAARLFQRFGYKDRLPYNRFATVLLTQPSRQLAEEMPGGLRRAGEGAGATGLLQLRRRASPDEPRPRTPPHTHGSRRRAPCCHSGAAAVPRRGLWGLLRSVLLL